MKNNLSFTKMPLHETSERHAANANLLGNLKHEDPRENYRIVICFAICPPFPPTPPSLELAALDPGFLSKIFQNLRLSSAAAVASIWPSGLKQLCRTRVS